MFSELLMSFESSLKCILITWYGYEQALLLTGPCDVMILLTG